MSMNNPQIGDTFLAKPEAFVRDSIYGPTELRFRVMYVNREHLYFTAEAECNGYIIRESWKF